MGDPGRKGDPGRANPAVADQYIAEASDSLIRALDVVVKEHPGWEEPEAQMLKGAVVLVAQAMAQRRRSRGEVGLCGPKGPIGPC